MWFTQQPLRKRLQWLGFAVVACLLVPTLAIAQQASSGIAGVARDTSGAVLPGVTVEASSPALIEKVRVVVTDTEGRYNIVSLPPGTYSVSFTLPGFSVFQREGVVLTAGFTATVNGDMRVGAVEETVTVTGEAPLVDTQNVRQQSQLSSELLEALPNVGAAISNVINLTPGVVGQSDVGGTAGVWVTQGTSNTIEFHGRTGLNMSYDGMGITGVLGNGTSGYLVNPLMVQELVVEKGGGTAESPTNQLGMNAVPRDGSNTFSFTFIGNYGNHSMQGDNLDDDLRARGVTSVDSVRYVYSAGGSAGGPIMRDKLWFFGSVQGLGNLNWEANNYYNKTVGTPLYTPDLTRPADQPDDSYRTAIRTTWQPTPRNKVNVGAELQRINENRRRSNSAPEAATLFRHKSGILQGTWSSPVNNKLLLEAGGSVMYFNFPSYPQPEVTDPATAVSIVDTALGGYRYNATWYRFLTEPEHNERRAQRASLSYVTGSHAFKTGVQLEQTLLDSCQGCNGPQPHIEYRFNNRVPASIIQYATPVLVQNRTKLDMGLYAQDQWALGRLSLNYGLRFDYFNGVVPAQNLPAARFVGARSFDEVSNAPLWTDISPRLGAAYDLFGNGRTAVKASFGRYNVKETVALNNALNPIFTYVQSVVRTWTDAPPGQIGNYVPDCDLQNFAANGECGPISDAGFGSSRQTTRYSEDVTKGFGIRPHSWDVSAELQHQLTDRVSLTAGWYRSDFSHLNPRSTRGTDVPLTPSAAVPYLQVYATDNLLVTPADYDPFCITAPRDPRLPGGGGYQVCGMYDIKPDKFGRVDNVVKQPSDFGDPVQRSNFVSFTVNTRFRNGALINGGLDTGQVIEDNCFVIDSPQALLHCRVETPWQSKTQLKVQGSYPLPADFMVSAILQNLPGVRYEANYTATNAEIAPSLGRNLAACGTRVPCTATVQVPLLPPMENFEPRRTQLDLRFSKAFRLNAARLQANFDIFNVTNDNSIVNINSAFGPRWLQPQAGGQGANSITILGSRMMQISGQLNF